MTIIMIKRPRQAKKSKETPKIQKIRWTRRKKSKKNQLRLSLLRKRHRLIQGLKKVNSLSLMKILQNKTSN